MSLVSQSCLTLSIEDVIFLKLKVDTPGGTNSLALTGSWQRRRKTVIQKPG